MAIVGRKHEFVMLDDGNPLVLFSEPVQLTVPPFRCYGTGETIPRYRYSDLTVLGTRTVQSVFPTISNMNRPFPVLLRTKQSGAAPFDVYPLTDTFQFKAFFQPKTQKLTCFWYWGGWTPFTGMTQPPKDRYAVHSVANIHNPAYLGSLAPNRNPDPFDPTRFWLAPISSAQSTDLYYFDTAPLVLGDNLPGEHPKLPDSPGSRKLLQLIERGLLEFPGPPETALNQLPTDERLDWELRGGVVAAGHHIEVAELRENPRWVSTPRNVNDWGQLPGLNTQFVSGTNWEDHYLILNALKAHSDQIGYRYSTRLLMMSSGTIESFTVSPNAKAQTSNFGAYPNYSSEQDRTFPIRAVVLEHPRIIAVMPHQINYRQVINPTLVSYPAMGSTDTYVQSHHDGFLKVAATPKDSIQHMDDMFLGDPEQFWWVKQGTIQRHLDLRSF